MLEKVRELILFQLTIIFLIIVSISNCYFVRVTNWL